MQNRRPPSFLRTKTTALHQGDWDSRIAPPSNISCKCSRTSSTSGGAIRRKHSLKGSVSSNSITCSAASVQPILFRSREKMLWCSISIRSNCRLAPEAIASVYPSDHPSGAVPKVTSACPQSSSSVMAPGQVAVRLTFS